MALVFNYWLGLSLNYNDVHDKKITQEKKDNEW